jgi:exonuclease VII large subunit
MGNRLFQQARYAVEKAEEMVKTANTPELLSLAYQEIEKAKNDLSSAFAQSTTAEKKQLAQFQDQIDQLQETLPEYR